MANFNKLKKNIKNKPNATQKLESWKASPTGGLRYENKGVETPGDID